MLRIELSESFSPDVDLSLSLSRFLDGEMKNIMRERKVICIYSSAYIILTVLIRIALESFVHSAYIILTVLIRIALESCVHSAYIILTVIIWIALE